MHALLLAFALAAQLDWQDVPDMPLPVVEQTVECVSVAHVEYGNDLIFFWDMVAGDWTCLDHRWIHADTAVTRDGAEWCVTFIDENDAPCYRVIRTRLFVESWEMESPLAEQNNRPWFAQLLEPGLKSVPKVNP